MAGATSANAGCSLEKNRFVVNGDPRPERGRTDQRAIRFVSRLTHSCVVGLEMKEATLGSHGLVDQSPCASSGLVVTSDVDRRRLRSPVRFTLTSILGSGLDGAWWPHTASIARELSGLTDALRKPLGKVVDIGVNWSPLQGVPNLDMVNRRGVPAGPGEDSRHLRVMTITGSRAKAHLLVVPSGTTMALAVMLLRQAADLPVLYAHQHTTAFHTAGVIVRAVRAQHSPSPLHPADLGSV
jgi:hypothetical protein